MNFHSYCKCTLILMTVTVGEKPYYDIMSGEEYVGSIKFCPVLGEWKIQLPSQHISVTFGFMAKVWECLIDELTYYRSTEF